MGQEDDVRQNAILGALPEPEFAELRDLLEVTEARVRDQVYEPGTPIADVFFPISAVYSMVGIADGRVVVEVATIGREGMAGLPVFLGRSASPHAAFCQVAGLTARMPADALRQALGNGTALHGLLGKFAQATMVQIGQNVVCNNTHDLSQRAARWLLTTHDRIRRDEFSLTQEFLGQMLGVTRPTVSQTAQKLQSQGLIRYARGKLTITDRAGLEQAACNCYAIVKAEFDGLVNGQ